MCDRPDKYAAHLALRPDAPRLSWRKVSHETREYYVILQGRGTLNLGSVVVGFGGGSVVMAYPGLRHRVDIVKLKAGGPGIISQARSAPNINHFATEET
jgi:mannose-6-phosphate isomerase-like protein (cupin superfamily)